MEVKEAEKRDLKPMAKILSMDWAGFDPFCQGNRTSFSIGNGIEVSWIDCRSN